MPVTGSVRIEYTGHGEQEERSCLKESLGKEHEKAGRNGQELLTISDKGLWKFQQDIHLDLLNPQSVWRQGDLRV